MSRASVVGMLVAAEVLIVGMAIYAVGRGRRRPSRRGSITSTSAAPIAPVAAGATPARRHRRSASRVIVGVPERRPRPRARSHGDARRDLLERPVSAPRGDAYPRRRSDRSSERKPRSSISLVSAFSASKSRSRGSRVRDRPVLGADVAGITGGVTARAVAGRIGDSPTCGAPSTCAATTGPSRNQP